MNQLEARLLESNGWEIECESPFEIYHSDSNSKATGFAAKIVLEELKRQDLLPDHHTVDQLNMCKICHSPLRLNVLRPEKCTNPNCKNYYHNK